MKKHLASTAKAQRCKGVAKKVVLTSGFLCAFFASLRLRGGRSISSQVSRVCNVLRKRTLKMNGAQRFAFHTLRMGAVSLW